MKIKMTILFSILILIVFFPHGRCYANTSPTKTLTVGMSTEWDVLHPYLFKTYPSMIILQALVKPLVFYSADSNLEAGLIEKVPTFENGLAKKIQNGKLSLDIKIRDGARWGDGVPVTCEDLQYGQHVATGPNVGTIDQEYQERLEKVEWQSSAPKKCRLIMKNVSFNYNDLCFYFPLPKHLDRDAFDTYSKTPLAYDQHTKYTTEPTNPALYYGPYVVAEYKLGSHVTLKRNPYFYGVKPEIEQITVRYVQSTTSLETFLSTGDIQMSVPQLGLSLDQALKLEEKSTKNSPFKIYFEQSLDWSRLYIDNRNVILSDRRVRQALQMAIDREELNNSFYRGKIEPAYNILPSYDVNFSKDLKYKKKGQVDLRRAKKILDEAGWKKGADGILVKDGRRLSFSFSGVAGNANAETLQIYIADKWKKLGVEANIKNYPGRVLIGEMLHNNKHEGILLLSNLTEPGTAGRTSLHSKSIPSQENNFSGLNYSNYANPVMDRLQDQLEKELDPKKRKNLVLKIQDIFFEDVPMIPLFFTIKNTVAPKDLGGDILAGPRGLGWEKIETWTWIRH